MKNARTILNKKTFRVKTVEEVGNTLAIPCIRNRTNLPLKSVTLSTNNVILQSCDESVTTDIEKHGPAEVMPNGKRHICFKNPHGLEDE